MTEPGRDTLSSDNTVKADSRREEMTDSLSAFTSTRSFSELLISSFDYLGRFDYDNYPVCFEEFRKKADPFFDRVKELPEPERSSFAEHLAGELAEEYAALPRREQKETLQRVRQVLAMFFTPAAEKHSPEARRFASAFREHWSLQFPRYPFLPGNYEKLMEGFAFNRMGLPLLKARRRRS